MNEIKSVNFPLIGSRLKEERKKLGYSQEFLGSIANVHPKYISEIERGLKNPTLNVIFKLTKAMDLPIETLIQ